MKYDPDMMARLQAATRQLMKDGPLAATAAIQRALAGDQPTDDETTDAPGGTMKDINPPPEHANKAKKASKNTHARQEDRQPPPGRERAKRAMPDIAELLAKAGISMPEGLQNVNLPGAKKRPPPPPLPDGARFDSASFTCHAGTRGYKLYVPSTYRSTQPMPLIVMLHGCTQDPDDFAAGTRMNQIAEETGALVAYPAQTQQANSSRCWNWFNKADQQREHGEPAIIAGIARQVMKDYAVDPAQVSIAGLSAGGAMAVIVAALYPELFTAAGVHSGLPFGSASDLPSALQAMKQGAGKHGKAVQTPPLIVFHGDKDHTVHPVNGEQVLRHGLVPGVAGTPDVERGKAPGGRKFTRTIHRGSDGRTLAEHWVLHGAGHAWAGGSASGSYTDGTGPDASREMVRFFAAMAKTAA